MQKPLLTYPVDRVALTSRCLEVMTYDDAFWHLAEDLIDTLKDRGLGLAAPQIGTLQRVFALNVGTMREVVIVNPRITWRSPRKERMSEGCLSMPNTVVVVERSEAIEADWSQCARGTVLSHQSKTLLTGMEARVFQHEYDHLSGRMFTSYIADKQKRFLAERGSR